MPRRFSRDPYRGSNRVVGAGTAKVEGAAHAQGERRARQGRGANASPRSGRCPPGPGKDTAPFQVLLNWKPQDEEDEEEEDRLGRKTAHVEAQGCETAWRAVKVLKHEGGSKAGRTGEEGRGTLEPRAPGVLQKHSPPNTHTHGVMAASRGSGRVTDGNIPQGTACSKQAENVTPSPTDSGRQTFRPIEALPLRPPPPPRARTGNADSPPFCVCTSLPP